MSWSDLPLELQVMIIEICPETLIVASRLTRALRELTAESFYRRVGTLPISSREMQQYLRTHPDKFALIDSTGEALIYVYEESGYKMSRSCVTYSSLIGRELSINLGEGYFNQLVIDWSFIVSKIKPFVELDLISQYHIWQRRLSCQRINPEYAKHQFNNYLAFKMCSKPPVSQLLIRPNNFIPICPETTLNVFISTLLTLDATVRLIDPLRYPHFLTIHVEPGDIDLLKYEIKDFWDRLIQLRSSYWDSSWSRNHDS